MEIENNTIEITFYFCKKKKYIYIRFNLSEKTKKNTGCCCFSFVFWRKKEKSLN